MRAVCDPYSGKYEEPCISRNDAVWSGTNLPTFRRNMLPTFYKYSRVYYNERPYNDRMLQLNSFIIKIRMLQRTRRNTIGRRSTRVRNTCRTFLL